MLWAWSVNVRTYWHTIQWTHTRIRLKQNEQALFDNNQTARLTEITHSHTEPTAQHQQPLHSFPAKLRTSQNIFIFSPPQSDNNNQCFSVYTIIFKKPHCMIIYGLTAGETTTVSCDFYVMLGSRPNPDGLSALDSAMTCRRVCYWDQWLYITVY